eukprot:TRINITY_DN5194_c0_g1_i1.p2 TRINITY_DN5194_c0_g1~~TRINITY_DN5194_c0_g1_i1.p2  ORF type:complete len:198 (-),score=54.56 TRINITY_DN5194_c0_g1_i1:1018-1611(-)
MPRKGALERVIEASRNPHLPSPPPSPSPIMLPGSSGDDLIISPRELRSVCLRFKQELTRHLLLRDFDEASRAAQAADRFITEYIASARQAMNTPDMQLADRLATAVKQAEARARALRGVRSPSLLTRVDALLGELNNTCERLRRCLAAAAAEQKFSAAAAAQAELRRVGEDYRRRMVLAYDRAVEADEIGAYSARPT